MTTSKTRIKITLAALVIVVAIIATTAAVLLGSKPFSVGQTVDLSEESTLSNSNNPKVDDTGIKRYLLIGQDDNHLTDTMIVVFCDFKKGEVRLLSIPRDTYVGGDIPTGKLNAVYSHAKYPYPERRDIRNLAWTYKTLFGIKLDGYIKLTFEGLRNAVDAVGGIPIHLPKSLFETHTQTVLLEAGDHVLDGEMAETFVRFRSGYVMGDLGRVEAQKRFLAAALNRVKELSASEITALLNGKVMNEIESDLTAGQLADLAKFLRGVSLENIYDYTLPGVEFTSDEGLACYAVHKKALLTLLNTEFYDEDHQLAMSDIGAPTVSGVDYDEVYESKKNNFADLFN